MKLKNKLITKLKKKTKKLTKKIYRVEFFHCSIRHDLPLIVVVKLSFFPRLEKNGSLNCRGNLIFFQRFIFH